MSDGGEDKHLTVLQQQTKALQAEMDKEGKATSKQIESIEHLPWHGNVEEPGAH